MGGGSVCWLGLFQFSKAMHSKSTKHASFWCGLVYQDKRMALATFASNEEAVAALCNCHNVPCTVAGATGPFNLKLSFAKPRPHHQQQQQQLQLQQ
jgi:hypothetical protein